MMRVALLDHLVKMALIPLKLFQLKSLNCRVKSFVTITNKLNIIYKYNKASVISNEIHFDEFLLVYGTHMHTSISQLTNTLYVLELNI